MSIYVSLRMAVLFHKVSGYTFTFISYFMSEYHIKTTNKTTSSNFALLSSQQNAYVGKMKRYVSE